MLPSLSTHSCSQLGALRDAQVHFIKSDAHLMKWPSKYISVIRCILSRTCVLGIATVVYILQVHKLTSTEGQLVSIRYQSKLVRAKVDPNLGWKHRGLSYQNM